MIAGISDRGEAFPQIGNIRKGAPKTKGENAPGRDLDYFRVELFREDLRQKFFEIYGPNPTAINVRLPFNDADKFFSSYYEAYYRGRMVSRAGAIYEDGFDSKQNYYLSKIDPETGEILAVAGRWVKSGEPAIYERSKPEFLAGKTQVYCKATTRMRVIIAEFHELAYVLFKSTSLYDAQNLASQLAAIRECGNFTQVPVILERAPVKVMCPGPSAGTKMTREMSLVSLRVDPEYAEKTFAYRDRLSEQRFLGTEDQRLLDIDYEPLPDEDDEEEDQTNGQQQSWELEAKSPIILSPDELKKQIIGFAQKAQPLDIKQTKHLLDYLAITLEDDRFIFLKWLAGKKEVTSTKDISKNLLAALYKYCKPTYTERTGHYRAWDSTVDIELREAVKSYIAEQQQVDDEIPV